ncbi:MAG: YbgC/FadM family acyl-CoA thioesterase [Betaproteobacteria bacterium]
MPGALKPPAGARRFAVPVRVYYQDTDAGGIMFHATYLDFLERARMEWLRTLGCPASRLVAEEGCLFIVRALRLEYLRPALLDELLDATLAVTAVGGAQFTLHQTVSGSEDCMRAEVNLACVSASRLRPVRLPARLRTALLDWLPNPSANPQ